MDTQDRELPSGGTGQAHAPKATTEPDIEPAGAELADASDGVDEQSDQSFPASDSPSWSGGLSL